MHVLVCVKQILDTTDVRFDPETGYLKRDGLPVTINSLDEYAVEEGLRLREKHGGKVTVLSMGKEKAVDTLKHAIAMGADEAVLLSDPALAGSDTAATAYALSRAVLKLEEKPDLIICGAETVDGNTAYVGPALATWLNLPYVTFVEKIDEMDGGKMTLRRMMEEGFDKVACPLPALITVVKNINEPRISSLKGKMKAKKYKPEVWALADLPDCDASLVGEAGSVSKVLQTAPPPPRPSGEMIEGEPEEIAEQLYAKLKG